MSRTAFEFSNSPIISAHNADIATVNNAAKLLHFPPPVFGPWRFVHSCKFCQSI